MQIDEDEHMERLQPDRLDREEVAGDNRSGLIPHELTPGVSFGPGRRFGEVIPRILEAEISMPSFLTSPWMRR